MRITFTRFAALSMLLGNCWLAPRVGAEPPANSKQPPAAASPKDRAQEELDQYKREERENPKFPKPNEVVSIEAETYGHPLRPLAPDIKPFLVPKKYYGKLLGFFRHAELDKEPAPFDDELGTMLIVSEDQGYVRICWFWEVPYQRLHFSYRGMRYRSTGERFGKDESMTVNGYVRWIHQIEVLHEDGGPEPGSRPYIEEDTNSTAPVAGGTGADPASAKDAAERNLPAKRKKTMAETEQWLNGAKQDYGRKTKNGSDRKEQARMEKEIDAQLAKERGR